MIKLVISTFLVCVFLLLPGYSQSAGRDPFLQPFSTGSPWNTPVGSKAQYQPIKGLETHHGGINHNERWSTGFWIATDKDRQARLYLHDDKLWDKLASGAVKTIGNSADVENALRQQSVSEPQFPANYYSTTVRSPPGRRTWPHAIRDVKTAWTNEIYLPLAAHPSPDSDAHLAVMQPNGLVLECYGAVVCGNGDVICTFASFSDPRGDGTGANNGRCASSISNYAGLIRKGEVAAGRIPHALSCIMSRLLLAPEAVWPAYAFDMNDRYEGTVPMGSLLAIPPDVKIEELGLSGKGLVIARAAQDYGVYVVDRGGDGGITLKAALDADDVLYPDRWKDAGIIVKHLQRIINNGPSSIGGGGEPKVPLAAPLSPAKSRKLPNN